MTAIDAVTIAAAIIPALINLGVMVAKINYLKSELVEAKDALAALRNSFETFRLDATQRLTRVETMVIRTVRTHDANR